MVIDTTGDMTMIPKLEALQVGWQNTGVVSTHHRFIDS